MSDEPRYWFRAKTYGYGWGLPATWEGWLALVAYLVVALAVGVALAAGPAVLIIVILAASFVILSYLKGEPAAWRWGRRRR